MKVTEHASTEQLSALLRGVISTQSVKEVEMHLAGCPLCRDLFEELWLKDSLKQMRDGYGASCKTPSQHISAETFAQLWSGEIDDDAVLEQVSEHCLSCRDCSQLGATLVDGKKPARQPVLVWAIVSIAALVLVALCAGLLFWRSNTTVPEQSPNIDGAAAVDALPDSLEHNAAVTAPLTKPVPPKKPKQQKMHPPQPLLAQTAKIGEVVTQTAEIDLEQHRFDLDRRGSGSEGDVEKPIEIPASSAHRTSLRIKLAEGGRKGWYVVRIEDSFADPFDKPLREEMARSHDGERLTVTFDLRRLPSRSYYLRILPQGGDSRAYSEPYPIFISHSHGKVNQDQSLLIRRETTLV